ncbi:MAG: flagellar assembly protein FliW [Planctomycetes bacterium]|nr:flagellar assembly protein FliW [Planctomycetota bacterium]
MKVKTSRFGEIDLPEESLITFPEGVVGFKDDTRFVIFDCGDEGIFKWLQSCDRPELAFVICEAQLIVPEYKVLIGEKERATLQLNKVEDGVVCLILTIPANPQEATANLLGPVVMNSENRIGMQMVLVNPEYSTKYKIFTQNTGANGGQEANNASA